MLCKNVVMKGELRLHDTTGYLVSIDVHCLSLCDKASDADIWASADMLAHSPKGELDKLEKATGLIHQETGFLRASFDFCVLLASCCVIIKNKQIHQLNIGTELNFLLQQLPL